MFSIPNRLQITYQPFDSLNDIPDDWNGVTTLSDNYYLYDYNTWSSLVQSDVQNSTYDFNKYEEDGEYYNEEMYTSTQVDVDGTFEFYYDFEFTNSDEFDPESFELNYYEQYH